MLNSHFHIEVHYGCCPEKHLWIVHRGPAVLQEHKIQGLLPWEAVSAKPGDGAGF